MANKRAIRLLFGIRLLHTVVVVVESVAILTLLYSGITGIWNGAVLLALLLVLAEIIVFLLNGARCPLTPVAQRLGTATGEGGDGALIADVFLPRWLSRLITPVCGTLAGIGLFLLILRLLLA